MDNPNPCLRRSGGRRLFHFFFKTDMLFVKVCAGSEPSNICQCLTILVNILSILVPKSHLWLNRRPQALFFVLEKNDMPFLRKAFLGKH